jgi:integrase
VPTLGATRVRDLRKAQVKALLLEKAATEDRRRSRNSLRIIHATLRAMLNAAVEDEVIAMNPAAKLGKHLRLIASKRGRQGTIERKALTREQLAAFLTGAWEHARRLYPLFLMMARTGIRIGEALALEWGDLDLHSRTIHIARPLADDGKRVDTPKSGEGRTVHLSRQLAETLRRLQNVRKAEALRRGWRELPPWMFVTPRATRFDPHNVRHAFGRVLSKAKLPLHFTPHSLRHTYASVLISEGKPIAYVQSQLGHASITLTVDTYGKWLPSADRAAVDSLDDAGWRPTPRIDAPRLVAADGSKRGAPGEVRASSGN